MQNDIGERCLSDVLSFDVVLCIENPQIFLVVYQNLNDRVSISKQSWYKIIYEDHLDLVHDRVQRSFRFGTISFSFGTR